MKRITLIVFLLQWFMPQVHAQWYGYNPYYNPFYVGNAIGNSIGQNIANNKAYGRNKLRKAIDKWGSCHNGTLTSNHGALAIYGDNGYHCTATVPEDVKDKLKEINKKPSSITDVNITEGGHYIIVYDGGKMWWGNLPSTVLNELRNVPSAELISSVSFNDGGTYAIVTNKHFYSNSQDYLLFHEQKMDELGILHSVNICGSGAVFCFEKGVDFCGSNPEIVSDAMKRVSFTPRFVKFNNRGDYIMCSKVGAYSYYIRNVNQSRVTSTVSKKPAPRVIKSSLVDEFYFNTYAQTENDEIDDLHFFETPKYNGKSLNGEFAVRFDLKSSPGHVLVEYKLIDRMDNSVKEKKSSTFHRSNRDVLRISPRSCCAFTSVIMEKIEEYSLIKKLNKLNRGQDEGKQPQ